MWDSETQIQWAQCPVTGLPPSLGPLINLSESARAKLKFQPSDSERLEVSSFIASSLAGGVLIDVQFGKAPSCFTSTVTDSDPWPAQ